MWFLLILASAQIAIGQEVPQQNIIRTSPVAVPGVQCVQDSGCGCGCGGARYEVENPCACDIGSQAEGADEAECCCCGADSVPGVQCVQDSGCGCGCGGARYEVENPCACDIGSQAEGADEAECCCCGADSAQSNEGSPSFSVAMLAPLASVLTTFMSGLGRSGNQAVTFDFDGQSSSKPLETPPQFTQCQIPHENPVPPQNPQCQIPHVNPVPPQYPPCQIPRENPVLPQYPQCLPHVNPVPPQYPQCQIPLENTATNQSLCNVPPSSPVVVSSAMPAINSQLPPRSPEAKHPLFGPHCYKRPKKGYSDIEEDSLYAFAQEKPTTKIYNSKLNQETASNLAFPRSTYSPENKQVQICRNDLQQSDNRLIQLLPSGNPNFDTISRLALSTSRQKNAYIPPSNKEQSFIPMI